MARKIVPGILQRTLRSLPLFLAYGQFGLMAICDAVLVGPLGTTPLAAIGFAANVLAPVFVFATALALALAPFAARVGAGDALRLLASCLRAQGIVAVIGGAAMLALSADLAMFRQPAEVTAAAGPYLRVEILALLPMVAFTALREYAIARSVSGPPALLGVLTVAGKLGLGALLVPGLGLAGAAASTAIACAAATGALAAVLARRGLFAGAARPLGPIFRTPLFAQGVSVALQQVFELGAYYFAGIMAGWLGEGALAAHSIGLNVAAGAALLSLAVAQTTAAEVGRRVEGRAAAAWGGAATALGVMVVVGAVVVLARGPLFSAAAEHTGLAIFVGLSLLADGVQIALGGALRGLLDARFFSIVSLACWWLFCLPLAYVLAFRLEMGVEGLWLAICVTLLLCAVIFAIRVASRSSAPPAR